MSLSVGTLNLKFMQRAAAQKAVASGTAAPAVVELPKGVDKAEEEAKWVLPARSRPATSKTAASATTKPSSSTASEAGPSRPKVQFVASYMPFVEDPVGAASGSAVSGGGRRAFGGWGDKPAAADDDDEDMSGAEDKAHSDDEVDAQTIRRKNKGKARDDGKRAQPIPEHILQRTASRMSRIATPEPEDLPETTFRKPAGFDDAAPKRSNSRKGGSNKSHSSSPAPGAPPKQSLSVADRMRATITSMKNVAVGNGSSSSKGKKRAAGDEDGDGSSPPAPASGESADGAAKRAKVDKKKAVAAPVKDKAEKKSGGPKLSAIDERAKALKAADKAAKKAAKTKGKQ